MGGTADGYAGIGIPEPVGVVGGAAEVAGAAEGVEAAEVVAAGGSSHRPSTRRPQLAVRAFLPIRHGRGTP